MGTVRVYPNPYVHLDHEGRPAGACPADPAHQPDRRAWVGATLDREKTVMTDEPAPGERRSPTQVTVFAFRAEVVELPDTPYYLDRIRDGELFAADARTASMVGIPFVDPAALLRRARERAEGAWRALYEETPPGLVGFVFDIAGPGPEPPSPEEKPS
jgi:hypothetical protein